MFGWFPDPLGWATTPYPVMGPHVPVSNPSTQREICRCFNEGKCRYARCHYCHSCTDCQGPHPRVECLHSRGRSHSPKPILPHVPGHHPPQAQTAHASRQAAPRTQPLQSDTFQTILVYVVGFRPLVGVCVRPPVLSCISVEL